MYMSFLFTLYYKFSADAWGMCCMKRVSVYSVVLLVMAWLYSFSLFGERDE